ncbi:MAG: hypothetical protein KA968_15365 [Chitinophagaceae bacterium]|jgi:hypothetical protein|nr:hypothetical protein [Chitinophagaceae bacterium]MBP8116071.1 hypothetical protein [Chitinophagaceae bacterium]
MAKLKKQDWENDFDDIFANKRHQDGYLAPSVRLLVKDWIKQYLEKISGENKNNIQELIKDYEYLSRMEENDFAWNIDILNSKFEVQIKEQEDESEN